MFRTIFNFLCPLSPDTGRRQFNWPVTLLLTYLGMFLFTFGHILALHPSNATAYGTCKERIAKDGTVIPPPDGLCLYTLPDRDDFETFFKSVGGGITWPFFWSWHLQAEKPHD